MIPLRAPEFWWQRAGITAALLYPAAAIYGAVAAYRLGRNGYRAKIPVICIGNPTLGGAGKTPTAIALAKLLKDDGKKVFFLTRGYGGSEQGPLLVDLKTHNATKVGDEALLLAAAAPTVVAHDRAAGAKFAETQGAEVIVMDDGFQNSSLAKNFSILVIDGTKGIGNGMPFPAGPLRAALAPQLKRAQAMLIIGEGEAGDKAARFASERKLPVFRAKIVPQKSSVDELKGKSVLAFAGIGAPEKFFHSLEIAGAIVSGWKSFGDHHRYSAIDAAEILAKAEHGGHIPVTTEKDFMRMQGDGVLAPLLEKTRILRIRLSFENENGFFAAVKNSLKL